MKIAYICSIVPQNSILMYSGGSIAGNKYQNGIVKSYCNECDYFTYLPYSSFPQTKKIIVKKNDLKSKKNMIYVIPYINILFIKQITYMINLLLYLANWAWRNRKNKDKILLIYNLFSFMDIPVSIISKIFNIKKFAIIADLPSDNPHGILEAWEHLWEKRAIKKYDGIVTITEHIWKDFAHNLPHLVIEGGVYSQKESDTIIEKEQIVLYTGALDANSSIKLLMDAFINIRCENWKLVIAGKGNFESMVRLYATNNKNIEYLGHISNSESIKLQKKAKILVSPRVPNKSITKYSFPSKIIEYLGTGNQVISFKLEGYPDEYLQYLKIPKKVSYEELSNTIKYCMKYDQYSKEQIKFIESKLWDNVSKKVEKFFVDIIKKDS